ncbi:MULTISPECIES: hypothetical protein [Methylopilaceae]|uniref:DNA primase/polymerase bifunctional N-terminal domain-containing protein n=1 Tax=Hansschlegelia zhihuaiae TaxID=405005 RepID=A0A4Q0M9U6_9HYPH|nr:hypothetical protein [Hansschlegelia zhihuaiae]RXF69977.1 hypothetical protein EK403_17790 [Hansschlegelia zhihuaiae]
MIRVLTDVQRDVYVSNRWFYKDVGVQMHNLGWPVFPQTRDRDSRRPFRAQPSEYRDALPSRWKVEEWTAKAGYEHNLALALGGSSSLSAIAIDVDISDATLSAEVMRIVFKTLGFTPFARIGSSPKVALVYRLDEPTRQGDEAFATIELPKGEEGKREVEFLGFGKVLTLYGWHHRWGSKIVWWRDLSDARPEDLPVITRSQLQRLRYEIQRRFTDLSVAKIAAAPVELSDVRIDNVRLPSMPKAGEKAREGRESLLHGIVWNLVRANPSSNYEEGDKASLLKAAIATFGEHAEMSGRFGGQGLVTEITERLNRFCPMMERGEISPLRGSMPTPTSPAPKAPAAPVVDRFRDESGAFSRLNSKPFVSPAWKGIQKVLAVEKSPEQVAKDREERKLLTQDQREAGYKRIGRAIDKVNGDFWEAVRDASESKQGSEHAVILRVPPGSGKTSQSARYAAQAVDVMNTLFAKPLEYGFVAFMLPDYNVLEEVVEKVAAVCREDGSPLAAIIRHNQPMPDLTDRVAVMVPVGKGRTACMRKAEMEALEAADISGSGLCEANVEIPSYRRADNGPKTERIQCTFMLDGCEFFEQHRRIKHAQIVFMVSQMETVAGKWLWERCVGRIVDEDTTTSLAKSYVSFDVDRANAVRHGRPTKAQADAGYDDDFPTMAREALLPKIVAEIKAGRCPSYFVKHWHDGLNTDGPTMLGLALSAVRRDDPSQLKIHPKISAADLQKIIDAPRKSPGASAERELLKIVEDRLESYDLNTPRRPLDARLQYVLSEYAGSEFRGQKLWGVRVSKRLKSKFTGHPLLVLDASASKRRVDKVYNVNAKVVSETVAPHLRVLMDPTRTYSVASFKPGPDAPPEQIRSARLLIDKVRRIIALEAAERPWSRILVVLPKAIEEVINSPFWRAPENVCWLHYGAVRGRDFAKGYASVITVGRQQMGIGSNDASACAFGCDDIKPITPFDLRGDGLTADEKPLMRPTVVKTWAMRSGEDVQASVPSFELGTFHHEIDDAAREQEVYQAAFRPRPIYSDAASAPARWICLGPWVPCDIVVDAIQSLDVMIANADQAESARGAGLLTYGGLFEHRDSSLKGREPLPAPDVRGENEALLKAAREAFPDRTDAKALVLLRRRRKRVEDWGPYLAPCEIEIVATADEERDRAALKAIYASIVAVFGDENVAPLEENLGPIAEPARPMNEVVAPATPPSPLVLTCKVRRVMPMSITA